MPKQADTDNYLKWAARARRQAEEATTDTARAIHLEIAKEYEAKAAASTDPT